MNAAVAYLCHCSNYFSCYLGTKQSPKSLALGRETTRKTTTTFGSLVLAEVPASLKKDCISRFEKATYLLPEFNSLGDVVVTVLAGQKRFFARKTFKIFSPLKWDVSLSPSALQFSTGCSLMFPLMISLRSLLNLCPLGLSSRWKIQMSRLFLHPGFMSMDRTY